MQKAIRRFRQSACRTSASDIGTAVDNIRTSRFRFARSIKRLPLRSICYSSGYTDPPVFFSPTLRSSPRYDQLRRSDSKSRVDHVGLKYAKWCILIRAFCCLLRSAALRANAALQFWQTCMKKLYRSETNGCIISIHIVVIRDARFLSDWFSDPIKIITVIASYCNNKQPKVFPVKAYKITKITSRWTHTHALV